MNKPSESTGSDDFFLNFGSSTNVCDQLRHGIRQEISEIDASIANIENDSCKEERTAQELQKNLSHCSKEMYNLFRSAKDCVESSTMNETLRFRMMEELTQELVNPYLERKEKDDDEVMKHNIESSELQNSFAYFEDCRRVITDINDSTRKAKGEIIDMLGEKREMEEKKESIQGLVKREELEKKKNLAKLDFENLTKEQEKERRRLDITREAIHEARTKSGDHAKEIADNTKILTSKRVEQELERNRLVKLLAKEETELLELESDNLLKKKLDGISHKVGLLVNQKAETEDAIKCRKEKSMLLEKVEDEIKVLNDMAAKKEAELEKGKGELMAAKNDNEHALLYKEQVLAQKSHNDRVEADKVVQGRIESQELKKAKASIAKSISIVDMERDTGLKELTGQRNTHANFLDNIEKEFQMVSDELERTNSAMKEIQNERGELQKATLQEDGESYQLIEGFKQAYNAEKTRLQDLGKGMKVNHDVKVREARNVSRQQRIKQEEWLELLKRGSVLIRGVGACEKEVEALKADRDSCLIVM